MIVASFCVHFLARDLNLNLKLSQLDSELAGCVPTVTFKLTPRAAFRSGPCYGATCTPQPEPEAN